MDLWTIVLIALAIAGLLYFVPTLPSLVRTIVAIVAVIACLLFLLRIAGVPIGL